MARGLRRGPVLLRFRSLVDSIAGYVAGIVDTRQLSKVRYTLRDCYLSAVALFFVQDRSLLQFQRRFQRKFQANNLSSTFGVFGSLATPSCAISSTAMAMLPFCPASPTSSVACSASNGSSTTRCSTPAIWSPLMDHATSAPNWSVASAA